MSVSQIVRAEVRVQGTVQGVGFRPYVYRLANELGLGGCVANDAAGVLIEVEGEAAAVGEFVRRLPREAPPLAVLESVRATERAPTGVRGFEIATSLRDGVPQAPVTPDSATCPDCLAELRDPLDRRFRYPFINCTNCGPRFTIVRGIPYDRAFTTMAAFAMCEECSREYHDPRDRRFHAQPNACPLCGPSVRLLDQRGRPAGGEHRDAVAAAAAALRAGRIVAVKGLGGYHLACVGADEEAVRRLRARKHREDKPFALMAADLQAAERMVVLDDSVRELLLGPQRPIVLAPRRAGAPVAGAVAPAARELGVMLPYTPLHHLLVEEVGGNLVMTSGNVSDEPIAYEDADALERLGAIADLFLVHDRPIETRTDDSVLRIVNARGRREPMFVRRSRGYVPAPLALPDGGTPRPLLACGAHLKHTFCVARGRRAWVSHHIGDLENAETLLSLREGIEHFQRLFAVTPEVVAHDLHPEYLSTKYALERDEVELVGVQHHHAHLSACLAEHDEPGPAVGAIFDGSGYGEDGTVWGGEILLGDAVSFERVGRLRPVRLPGGEQAIRQPWRMACAWLAEVGDPGAQPPAGLLASVTPERWRQISGLVATGTASPLTTSVGRLFDAVAALCGIRSEITYEGQAAVELEAACDPSERGAYEIEVGDGLELDPRSAVAAVVADIATGASAGSVAARFHHALSRATVEACARAAQANGCELAVLSGGVFANRRLFERTAAGLSARGLRVLFPRRLPPGDGGISYGQAAVAAARLRAG